MANRRIPIAAARRVAEEQDLDQVILVGWSAKDGLTHVVTYGKTKAGCVEAASGGNMIKRALGFPEDKCNDVPARAKVK